MWMVRDAVDDLANSHGRTTRHIATGLVITGGAVALAALIAHLAKPAPEDPEAYSDYEELNPPEPPKPPSIFSTVWPPLFVALTLSGFRVWNAPSSFARTQALALWGLVQGLNAGWLAWGPKRIGGRMATAGLTLGTSALYAWRVRRVDPASATLVAPYVGWIAFANLLTHELWQRNLKPTLADLPSVRLFRPRGRGTEAWPPHP